MTLWKLIGKGIWKIVNKIYNFMASSAAYFVISGSKRQDDAVFLTSLSIGDTVYGLAYIEEYKKRNPDKKVIVIADEGKKDLIQYYNGIDEVRYFARNSLGGGYYLLKLNASAFYAKKGIRRCIYNTIPWVNYGYHSDGRDCLMLMRKLMQLPDDVTPVYPKAAKPDQISGIAEFASMKNHIAVINPYTANKNYSECQILLETIVRYLKDKNFAVYCNAVKSQPIIAGTKRLDCTIQELYAIAEEIPLIISIRSGIMDYLVGTRAAKIVIYPSNRTQPFKDMYHMKAWGVDNIWEFSIDESQEFSTEMKELIDKISESKRKKYV